MRCVRLAAVCVVACALAGCGSSNGASDGTKGVARLTSCLRGQGYSVVRLPIPRSRKAGAAAEIADLRVEGSPVGVVLIEVFRNASAARRVATSGPALGPPYGQQVGDVVIVWVYWISKTSAANVIVDRVNECVGEG
jgi:hypothetical protein